MQCKDIADRDVLWFLSRNPTVQARGGGTALIYNEDDGARVIPGNAVQRAMPVGVPDKLALAKMRQMIRRGVVSGCACGCRGDFQITDAGWAEIGGKPGPRPTPKYLSVGC